MLRLEMEARLAALQADARMLEAEGRAAGGQPRDVLGPADPADPDAAEPDADDPDAADPADPDAAGPADPARPDAADSTTA
jgi:hypothetical protein